MKHQEDDRTAKGLVSRGKTESDAFEGLEKGRFSLDENLLITRLCPETSFCIITRLRYFLLQYLTWF